MLFVVQKLWDPIMIPVSATALRNHLFKYLKKVTEGETIIILRNKKEVARIVSSHTTNWRDKISIKPRLLVPPQDMINPLDDIWEEYS